MEILLHITTPDAVRIATPLGQALARQGVAWGCFLTNDGVKLLGDPAFIDAGSSALRLVVCEKSWETHMSDRECPVEMGSQTINSALMAEAHKVVSL